MSESSFPVGSVCAIVVTYNRLVCLARTLEALRGFPLDIVVVDNASTDGTREFLEAAQGIHSLFLEENRGGSGGFAAGMRWACARGYRWLWVMDDDVVPLPNALAVFARHAVPNACLTPARLTASGEVFEFEGRINWQTLKRRYLPHAKVFRSADAVPCETACFEGMFVDARLAARLIEPWEAYFLSWDDYLFGMLASKLGATFYLRDFCIQKQFDKRRQLAGGLHYSSSLFGRYFHLRNYCLTARYLRSQNLGGRLIFLRYPYEWLKAAILTVLVERNLAGLRFLVLAFLHGMRGDTRAVRDFLPALLNPKGRAP